MNYRHDFHAGNFADVLKHVVLCSILVYLRRKPAGFRVVDTHAGAGLYDLTGAEATRGAEWQDGIAKLLSAKLSAKTAAVLAPYLEVIGALNERGQLRVYPGSPALTRAWLRPQDRLVACELEPKAATALARNLRGDSRIKTLRIDGWTALNAYVPPKERRGVVLVDPSYEADNDFTRLFSELMAGYRKWPTGIYLLWYPIKGRGNPDLLARRFRRSGLQKALRAEIQVGPLSDPSRLNGCGLIVVNPPWTLEQDLSGAGAELATILAREGKPAFRLDWLTGETGPGPH
ncbi:MAG TPA: 23S rRNA (adenine(2030)-N(6))-methyltransferase RlmJ [Pseudolabrys sp.]|nr:23S rRNA (adenine(2030)-N(6))-methyltransferase RlmJ [Pseudolabrys sp.]